MKMLKTLLKTSASKKAARDPDGLHATINIAWKSELIQISIFQPEKSQKVRKIF